MSRSNNLGDTIDNVWQNEHQELGMCVRAWKVFKPNEAADGDVHHLIMRQNNLCKFFVKLAGIPNFMSTWKAERCCQAFVMRLKLALSGILKQFNEVFWNWIWFDRESFFGIGNDNIYLAYPLRATLNIVYCSMLSNQAAWRKTAAVH